MIMRCKITKKTYVLVEFFSKISKTPKKTCGCGNGMIEDAVLLNAASMERQATCVLADDK